MVINWPEIGLQTAIILAILAVVGAYVRYWQLPKLEAGVAQWVGAAIGRFMQNLANQAAEEEGSTSVGAQALNLGGFKIDPQLIELAIKYGPQLIELAKSFGLIKGGGGGTNPFLTP